MPRFSSSKALDNSKILTGVASRNVTVIHIVCLIFSNYSLLKLSNISDYARTTVQINAEDLIDKGISNDLEGKKNDAIKNIRLRSRSAPGVSLSTC